MYQLLPFVFFMVIVLSMIGFAWALFSEDRPGLALVLFVIALVMIFPMLGSVQAGRAHTEQDLVVIESGKVVQTIENVHSVNYGHDGDVVTFTYRNGRVGQIVTSVDRDVKVKNAHPYKEEEAGDESAVPWRDKYPSPTFKSGK